MPYWKSSGERVAPGRKDDQREGLSAFSRPLSTKQQGHVLAGDGTCTLELTQLGVKHQPCQLSLGEDQEVICYSGGVKSQKWVEACLEISLKDRAHLLWGDLGIINCIVRKDLLSGFFQVSRRVAP